MSTQSDPIWFVPICCGLLAALSVAASPGLRSVAQRPVAGADPSAFAALPPADADPGSAPPSDDMIVAESGSADPFATDEPSLINPADLELIAPDDPALVGDPRPADPDEPLLDLDVPSTELPPDTPVDDLNSEPAADDDRGDPPSTRCSFVANDVEVGRAIRRRRIAATDIPFESDGRPVFAWFDVTNRDRELQETRVRWHHDGTGHTIESTAPMRAGSHWQFYVESTLPPLMLGNWRVELLDESDCVVTTTTFELVPMGWRTAAPAR